MVVVLDNNEGEEREVVELRVSKIVVQPARTVQTANAGGVGDAPFTPMSGIGETAAGGAGVVGAGAAAAAGVLTAVDEDEEGEEEAPVPEEFEYESDGERRADGDGDVDM